MSLKPIQGNKSGTPRTVSSNPVNKTGRPDHPPIIDGNPEAGKVGTVSNYNAYGTSRNPVKKGGRSSGMGPDAGVAGEPGGNQITTSNARAFVRATGHNVSEANQMGTSRLSNFKGG